MFGRSALRLWRRDEVVLQVAVARILNCNGLLRQSLQCALLVNGLFRDVEHRACEVSREGGTTVGVQLPFRSQEVITCCFGRNGISAFFHARQADIAVGVRCLGVRSAIVGRHLHQAVGYGVARIERLNRSSVRSGVPYLHVVNEPVVDVACIVTPSAETNLKQVVVGQILVQGELVSAPAERTYVVLNAVHLRPSVAAVGRNLGGEHTIQSVYGIL